MEKPRYIVAIDPDISKSGFCIVDSKCRTLDTAYAASFMNVVEKFMLISQNRVPPFDKDDTIVVIEDSDNTNNWHLPAGCSPRAAAAIGHTTGLGHGAQRLIMEAAEYFGLKVVLQAPLKKNWLGRDGKITQEEIRQFVPDFPQKSNQEVRDAVLLAWCYANLPIHIPASFYTQRARKDFEEKVKCEEVFLFKAKGVQADKDGLYHNEGILAQTKDWYEKARKNSKKVITTKDIIRLEKKVHKLMSDEDDKQNLATKNETT